MVVRERGWAARGLACVGVAGLIWAVVLVVKATGVADDQGFNRLVGWSNIAAYVIAAAGFLVLVWDRLHRSVQPGGGLPVLAGAVSYTHLTLPTNREV